MSKFDEEKTLYLRRFELACRTEDQDAAIIPLLEKINALNDFYTTSSCSGRVCLFSPGEKKGDADLFLKAHDDISFEIIWRELEKHRMSNDLRQTIWFRQEGIILHACARNLAAAKRLLALAHEAGIKHSGIMSFGSQERLMLEILDTDRMELPIVENGKILVSEEYLRLLVALSAKRIEHSRKKMRRLLELINSL